MKTIIMICRSKDEMTDSLVHLVEAIFPECDIQTIYHSYPEKSTSGDRSEFPSPSSS